MCSATRSRFGGGVTEMGIMSPGNDPFSCKGEGKDLQTFAPLNNLDTNLWIGE